MRPRPPAPASAAFVFVLVTFAPTLGHAAGGAAGGETRTLRLELATPGGAGGRFAVENLVGTMRVTAGDGDRVVAIATVHAESRDLAGLVRFEQVTGKDGVPTLLVRYPLDRESVIRYTPPRARREHWLASWLGGSTTRLDYDGRRLQVSTTAGAEMFADVEVQVPRGADGEFRNLVGRIDAEGLKGRFGFHAASGDLRLRSLDGEMKTRTGSGDVDAERLRGTLGIETGSGDVRLDGFEGDQVAARTGSGDLVVRAAKTGKLDLVTGSGDVRGEGVEVAEVRFRSGSGDLVLNTAGERLARIDLQTGSGDAVIRLGGNASFDAAAEQGSGSLSCRYHDAEKVLRRDEVVGCRRGDGRAQIRVRTGSGDVVIEE